MMEAPAISVVMSVYDGEVYLAEAVESILAQTFRDFEFIVIDDGSKDQTGQMLADYARRDGRVRVVTQENRGRAESLNRGINMARAEWIARMDADDVALPERLARQWGFLQAHPDVGLLGTAVENISPEGDGLGYYMPPTKDSDLREAMLSGNAFRHPTVVMRKEIAIGVGGYRKALLDADDYDMWLRMAERTKVANLREALVRYRYHAKQASVANMAHQMICCRAAQVAALRRQRGLDDPLEAVMEITAGFVRELGISDAEIRRDVAAGYCHWICAFAVFRPDEALEMLNILEKMRASGPVPRRYLADSYFAVARLHMRRGHLGKALSFARRGFFAHPLVAGRVARMAVARRVSERGLRVSERIPT